ncbi:MAG TPA: universal stress protein [Streptosporangiaceae bacterium]|nr:universal stress protein [Streptosporangiaceae bacterium]
MDRMNRAAIVVGVSGSIASAAALSWAAAESRRRHAPLRVVRSWDPEFSSEGLPAGVQMVPAQQRRAAGESLASVLSAAFGPRLPGYVTAELAEGVSERVLADRSAGADLLVLGCAAPPAGARGAARSIGPVVRSCLSRAHCPVAVISPDSPTGRDTVTRMSRPAAVSPEA